MHANTERIASTQQAFIFATHVITNYQPRLPCPTVKRNRNDVFLNLLPRDGHIGRWRKEENPQRFCNVGEQLRSRVVLPQKPCSPFPSAERRINALRAEPISSAPVPFSLKYIM